eukprot:GHVN01082446.1.p1 GENE.GHVN01082446.1~~GHVN01082446.1.p1  ORF type:complete len:527 (-),score=79.22 GHVN01082446.1:509-1870(-)
MTQSSSGRRSRPVSPARDRQALQPQIFLSVTPPEHGSHNHTYSSPQSPGNRNSNNSLSRFIEPRQSRARSRSVCPILPLGRKMNSPQQPQSNHFWDRVGSSVRSRSLTKRQTVIIPRSPQTVKTTTLSSLSTSSARTSSFSQSILTPPSSESHIRSPSSPVNYVSPLQATTTRLIHTTTTLPSPPSFISSHFSIFPETQQYINRRKRKIRTETAAALALHNSRFRPRANTMSNIHDAAARQTPWSDRGDGPSSYFRRASLAGMKGMDSDQLMGATDDEGDSSESDEFGGRGQARREEVEGFTKFGRCDCCCATLQGLQCRFVDRISVTMGLPSVLFGAHLAHEMLHAYLHLSVEPTPYQPLPPAVEEGLCNAVSVVYLRHMLVKLNQTPPNASVMHKVNQEKELCQFALTKFQINKHPVYGEGYRQAIRCVDLVGTDETFRCVRLTKNLPLLR